MAYEELEPFGAEYQRYLARGVCSIIANFSQMRMKDKKGEDIIWESQDFFPSILDPERPKEKSEENGQSVDEMKQVLLALAAGQQKRERKNRPTKRRRR